MLNAREEALIALKRTCQYYISAIALLFFEDQKKMKKEQAKEEITPTRKKENKDSVGEEMFDQKTSLRTLRSVIDRTLQGRSKRLQKYLKITPDLFQGMVEKFMRAVHERTAGCGTQAGNHPLLLSYWKFVSKSTVQLQS